MKVQKQKLPARREPQGDDYVLLVDSPHWKPGVVLQFIMKDWWYGHDPIAEFREACERDGCTVLVCQRAPVNSEDYLDGRSRYLSQSEAWSALKARGLLTPERAKWLEAVGPLGPLPVDPRKPI